jgi:hypothetical protein
MKTWIRTASLALPAALAVAVAGCGNSKSCTDATPPVAKTPAACTVVQGSALTVPVNTCPRCDQSTPVCDVRAIGGGVFSLEPISQVCDPNSSCPIPNPDTCAALATGCTLSAAMTAPLDPTQPYHLEVQTETGVVGVPLTVLASGSTPPTTPCTF